VVLERHDHVGPDASRERRIGDSTVGLRRSLRAQE
jgi:hypothetical protein